MIDGIDISNYTSPLTQQQIDFVRANFQFVIIGIQDAQKARDFQAQLHGMELQYYLDRPRRDWNVFPWYANTKVWVDIETNCYERVEDVNMDLSLLANIGCVPGIYCNKVSLGVLDGPPSPEWGQYPLWFASYFNDRHKPYASEFTPFHTWQKPEIWQYSEKGINGINCDLNVRFDEPPPVQEDYVTHFTQYFASGKVWEIDAVPPPGR